MYLIGTIPLETEHLILRRIQEDDYKEAYRNLYSNKKIAKYSLWDEHKSEEFTRKVYEIWQKEYMKLDSYRWVIILKENNELIGSINSEVNKYEDFGAFEVGYCLAEKYWNKGYTTEALKRVIKFFFEDVDANVVYAECMSDNIASSKVMEKSNMKKEGILRNRIIDKENKLTDLISYSITKEEYKKITK